MNPSMHHKYNLHPYNSNKTFKIKRKVIVQWENEKKSGGVINKL